MRFRCGSRKGMLISIFLKSTTRENQSNSQIYDSSELYYTIF